MSLCIYYGRDCGYEERDALLEFLETIDDRPLYRPCLPLRQPAQ